MKKNGVFNIVKMNNDRLFIEERVGSFHIIEGIDIAIEKNNFWGDYTATHLETGHTIASGDTVKGVIEKVRKNLITHKDIFPKLVEKAKNNILKKSRRIKLPINKPLKT